MEGKENVWLVCKRCECQHRCRGLVAMDEEWLEDRNRSRYICCSGISVKGQLYEVQDRQHYR